MKALIIAAICLVFVNCDLVNKGTWTADTSNQFAGKSIEELRQYTGTFVTNFGDGTVPTPDASLPQNFDPRTDAAWGSCVHTIRNQGQCGSCWAFGLTEAFTDRQCVATFDSKSNTSSVNVTLSPEHLVSCDTENYGCGGGYLNLAWQFAQNTGIVSDACFPYDAEGGVAAPCTSTCKDGSAWAPYKAKNVRALSATDGQQTMFTQGPIETAFMVYEDFFSYTKGVYTQQSQEFVGGHAIKVIGWGFDKPSGLNYWIAHNSWGTSWGMNGLFWIAFGQCEFDSNFIVGDYTPKQDMTYIQSFEQWVKTLISKF